MSEILGVLFKYLLALLGIAAVVSVLYEALGSSSVSDAASDIAQMQANVYSLYQGTGNTTAFGAASASQLIASGVIPSGMIQNQSSTSSGTTTNGQVIMDPFGQKIVAASGTTAHGNPVLGIIFAAVPTKACSKLVLAAVQAGASATVNGTTLYPGTASAVTAAGACAASTNTVSMEFNFYPSNGASTAASSATS